jgi:hypothetical protein
VRRYSYGTADWLGGEWRDPPPPKPIAPGGVVYRAPNGVETDGESQRMREFRASRLCRVCDEMLPRTSKHDAHLDCAAREARRGKVVAPKGEAFAAREVARQTRLKAEKHKAQRAAAKKEPPPLEKPAPWQRVRDLLPHQRKAMCECGHSRAVHATRTTCSARWPQRCGCRGFTRAT